MGSFWDARPARSATMSTSSFDDLIPVRSPGSAAVTGIRAVDHAQAQTVRTTAMSERVLDRVMELADQFKEQAVEAEKIGKLPDATVKSMKAIGSIRLLQPERHSGLEVHPREFAETVMATAALDPAAGWINGVVGVHPYQLAYATRGSPTRSGPTTSTPGSPRRTPRRGWPSPSTAATSSTAAGSSAPAPTPATGSSWAPCSATPTASRDAAADAAHDPAAQGLRDRAGFVGRRGAAGHRLEGHHRQGRVRSGVPDDGRDEGHGRHGPDRRRA